MLVKKSSLSRVEVENARGGNGVLHRWDYIKEALPCSRLTMMSWLDINPGVSVGRHPHNGNFESYIVFEGTGRVWDNDSFESVEAGDLLLTSSGEQHSIENTGSTTLRVLAFICEQSSQG